MQYITQSSRGETKNKITRYPSHRDLHWEISHAVTSKKTTYPRQNFFQATVYNHNKEKIVIPHEEVYEIQIRRKFFNVDPSYGSIFLASSTGTKSDSDFIVL